MRVEQSEWFYRSMGIVNGKGNRFVCVCVCVCLIMMCVSRYMGASKCTTFCASSCIKM